MKNARSSRADSEHGVAAVPHDGVSVRAVHHPHGQALVRLRSTGRNGTVRVERVDAQPVGAFRQRPDRAPAGGVLDDRRLGLVAGWADRDWGAGDFGHVTADIHPGVIGGHVGRTASSQRRASGGVTESLGDLLVVAGIDVIRGRRPRCRCRRRSCSASCWRRPASRSSGS